jgi:hypothetical protein
MRQSTHYTQKCHPSIQMEETVINTVNNSVTRREEAKVKDHGSPYVQQIISFLLLNLGSSYVTSKKN